MSDIITLASGAVIILVFLLFCFEERKLYSIKEILVKLVNSENILDSLNNSKIASLGEKYEKTTDTYYGACNGVQPCGLR